MKKSFYINFIEWLKSTELFTRPSKQIVGEWDLVEYYMDTETELVNVSELQLKERKQYWRISFSEEKKFHQQNNLKNKAIDGIANGKWESSRNYIKLYSSGEIEKSYEFQFAVDKGRLKLLKKDSKGSIEFFGFFKPKGD